MYNLHIFLLIGSNFLFLNFIGLIATTVRLFSKFTVFFTLHIVLGPYEDFSIFKSFHSNVLAELARVKWSKVNRVDQT